MGWIIFSVIFVVVLYVVLGLEIERGKQTVSYRMRPRQIFAVFGFLIMIFGCFTIIEANQVGVKYDPFNGGLQTETLNEGFQFKAPWVQIYKVPTELKTISMRDVPAQTGVIRVDGRETGGGQWASYEVSLQFRIESSNAITFYRTFNSADYNEAMIKTQIRMALQASSAEYDIFSILKGERTSVEKKTQDRLVAALAPMGIQVVSFIIEDVDGGKEIEETIVREAQAAKQIEINQKEKEAALIKAEQEKQIAIINAQREAAEQEIRNQKNIDQALADAEAEVTRAKGKAEAEELLTQVTARAINNMYEAQFATAQDKTEFENAEDKALFGYLTVQEVASIVLEQLYYDTWNGVLPEIIMGSDGALSILLPRG